MKTTPKHTMPPGYHNALKAALHGIPEAHPVDRNTEKPRARPVVSLWRYAAVGVAASLALIFWFDTAPSDPALSDITALELYELGYVEVEDVIDLTEPDSLNFLDAAIELELLMNYTNPNDYLYEL
ncbi:MAG: hypothetical protein PVK00_02200 [Flavobacteriales bacterium]|jgi:hypothetical protein